MLSSDLMSSTLFGHKKGSFTGAISDAVGKVEVAEGGTLFLDEVADLSSDAQARLLRFLHDRRFERLGDTTERKADVRIIAATNRPLEDEVKAGRFREDLLFRLLSARDVRIFWTWRSAICGFSSAGKDGRIYLSPPAAEPRLSTTRGRAICGSCAMRWSAP
jgi:sigma54-dependent transcription regulator